jgi:hypothetical protein
MSFFVSNVYDIILPNLNKLTMKNSLGKIGCAIGLATALGASACEGSKEYRDEDYYRHFEVPLSAENAALIKDTRGKMEASIMCFADEKAGKIRCNIPRGDAPWKGPYM